MGWAEDIQSQAGTEYSENQTRNLANHSNDSTHTGHKADGMHVSAHTEKTPQIP